MKKRMSLKNLTGIALACGILFMASCVKNRNDGAVDFSQLTPIVLIPEGGLKNFSTEALTFPAADVSDSTTFRVNYAAKNVAPNDVVVTLAIDDASRLAYNASHTDQYEKMPDSVYSFTTTKVTVKAGQSYSDVVTLIVYPNKVNSSKSYMLPITITDASGVQVSGNFGTIYYHIIGNPLAGNYQDYGQRYNYTGSVSWSGPAAGLGLATAPGVPPAGVPAGGTLSNTYNMIVAFSPVNAQTVTATVGNVPDPYSGLAYYFVTGTDTLFTNITYDFEPTWYSNPAGVGYSNTDRFVRGYVPPTATQKPAFRLITHYNNALAGAGNDRIIDETFLHQ